MTTVFLDLKSVEERDTLSHNFHFTFLLSLSKRLSPKLNFGLSSDLAVS